MKRNKVELLAPAGNLEGFYGTIHAGADAVYLGGDKFGARAYADNFTTQELVGCIRYAHIRGRRVYLTVNTLVKDKEWEQLYDYILPFYEAGLDGVIIQDLGVFLYLREHFPQLELHVSTQMTLTGAYGAAYLKELGACRIVPARELSLSEIQKIKQDTGLEIEAFIHGAMCYCYSGQCLFSSILGGRSGNRGRCAQPCRLPYTVTAGKQRSKECYPLSLKDMCTIEHLPELIEAGIDSFKIEGRMKKPEYAAGVTAIYRRAIDRYYARPDCKQLVTPDELKELSSLYIRSERQDGYYHKHNGADMVTLQSPAYSGSDEQLLQRIRMQYLEQKPRFAVDICAQFHTGKPACLTLTCQGASVSVSGEIVQEAQKQPISQENIKKQLQKLGDTAFVAENISIRLSGQAFYPLKAINELRRTAVQALEDRLIREHGLCVERCGMAVKDFPSEKQIHSAAPARQSPLSITIRTREQLDAVISFLNAASSPAIRRLYVEGDLLSGQDAASIPDALRSIRHKPEIFAVLPPIIRERDHAYLQKLLAILHENADLLEGCMVRSLEGYAYLVKHDYQGKLSSDAGFYIWNRRTLAWWQDKLDSFCLPYELNAGEQKTLLASLNGITAEKVLYGYLPMMVTANCVIQTTSGCRLTQGGTKRHEALHQKGAGQDTALQQEQSAFLTDRYQKQFPVIASCHHCMNIIYNSVPLSLHNSMHKWQNIAGRLDFTIESGEQVRRILTFFYNLTDSTGDMLPFQEYTTGHEKRGVE